jgi:hypothetical protein
LLSLTILNKYTNSKGAFCISKYLKIFGWPVFLAHIICLANKTKLQLLLAHWFLIHSVRLNSIFKEPMLKMNFTLKQNNTCP